MLISLRITNFALIDQLDLEFGPGLNVFTGETGAGKSIILDALDIVLGGKVNSRTIRTGAKRAIIEATFELDTILVEWFKTQEIDLIDGTLAVCSRDITASDAGVRSRSRLNGILVNRQLIEQIREQLLEITAQGQALQIGQPTRQRDWLDLYGGTELLAQRQAVSMAYQTCQEAKLSLEYRRQSEQKRLQRLDLLQYQIQELAAANLTNPDEIEQLEIERQRLSHVVELQQQSYQVYQVIYQNDNDGEAAADLLSKAQDVVSDMVVYDGNLQTILDLISEALDQVTEAGRQISNYGESLEADPQRLQEVEDRIRELKQICRKYGLLNEVIIYYQDIQQEIADLTTDNESLENLEQSYKIAENELEILCKNLTLSREKTSLKLSNKLIESLKPLAMEKVKFCVEISPILPTVYGADRITFLFSSNPGEPLHPLTEVASGGEMSRFLLALKTCFSQVDKAGTLVFDEIDIGVSGKVATAIGENLHDLSQNHQVLCVTHQPLVAAMADRHFHVEKQTIDMEQEITGDIEERTIVKVHKLDRKQRREELAQLASGRSAQEALAFADSLLIQAAKIRKDN